MLKEKVENERSEIQIRSVPVIVMFATVGGSGGSAIGQRLSGFENPRSSNSGNKNRQRVQGRGSNGVDDDDDDDDDDKEQDDDGRGEGLDAWERAYADERSWESLQEDESGLLRPIDPQTFHYAQYRRRLLLRSSAEQESSSLRIQKGLIRYLYIVIDLSRVRFVVVVYQHELTMIEIIRLTLTD